MPALLVHLLLAFVITTIIPRRGEAQAGGSCLPADETTATLIVDILRVAAEPGADGAQDRALFGVPVVSDTQVVVVTDPAICIRLVEARNRQFSTAGFAVPTSTAVYVVRMGTRYALLDPEQHAGNEFRTVYVYDDAFRPVGSWAGP